MDRVHLARVSVREVQHIRIVHQLQLRAHLSVVHLACAWRHPQPGLRSVITSVAADPCASVTGAQLLHVYHRPSSWSCVTALPPVTCSHTYYLQVHSLDVSDARQMQSLLDSRYYSGYQYGLNAPGCPAGCAPTWFGSGGGSYFLQIRTENLFFLTGSLSVSPFTLRLLVKLVEEPFILLVPLHQKLPHHLFVDVS